MMFFILTNDDVLLLETISSSNRLIPSKLKNGKFAISTEFVNDPSFAGYHDFLLGLEQADLTAADFLIERREDG